MITRNKDEKVDYYSKTVEITDTGMVIASVFAHAADGHRLRRVGLKFFTPLFRTTSMIEKSAAKSHKWADEYIKVCNKHEVQYMAEWE